MINFDKKFCYRICHVHNLPHILLNGLCTKYHPKASKNFISIGNTDIISLRDKTLVKIEGYGNIGEYVPFYFTPKSMMLFNILTGYRAPVVPKLNKEEVIVIRCLIDELSKCNQFFFTDGQANVTAITQHYNDLSRLADIDWEIIDKSDFKKTGDDTDKQRRYQAEFLVHQHVPVNFIESINVYNEKVGTFIKKEMAKTDILLPVHVKREYFFD